MSRRMSYNLALAWCSERPAAVNSFAIALCVRGPRSRLPARRRTSKQVAVPIVHEPRDRTSVAPCAVSPASTIFSARDRRCSPDCLQFRLLFEPVLKTVMATVSGPNTPEHALYRGWRYPAPSSAQARMSAPGQLATAHVVAGSPYRYVRRRNRRILTPFALIASMWSVRTSTRLVISESPALGERWRRTPASAIAPQRRVRVAAWMCPILRVTAGSRRSLACASRSVREMVRRWRSAPAASPKTADTGPPSVVKHRRIASLVHRRHARLPQG